MLADYFQATFRHSLSIIRAKCYLVAINHRKTDNLEHFVVFHDFPRCFSNSIQATVLGALAGCICAAQNLNSGILPNGSSCGLVKKLAGASA